MIYTGYYSKVKEYKSAGLTTVSISRTQPFGTDGKIESLSPDNKILWDHKNGLIDQNEYTNKYIKQLEKIGIRNILLSIHSFGDDVVLLCWESPERFCHRHILADYINQHSKLHIEEYNKTD